MSDIITSNTLTSNKITFEWAKQNRHNDKLAEFVFLFCPPSDTPNTPSIFCGKRDVWLSKLSEALEEKETKLQNKKH